MLADFQEFIREALDLPAARIFSTLAAAGSDLPAAVVSVIAITQEAPVGRGEAYRDGRWQVDYLADDFTQLDEAERRLWGLSNTSGSMGQATAFVVQVTDADASFDGTIYRLTFTFRVLFRPSEPAGAGE